MMDKLDFERLRAMVLVDMRERVDAVVAAGVKDEAIGFLRGCLLAYAMSEVITYDEYHDFQDELEAVGLSDRIPGWDRVTRTLKR